MYGISSVNALEQSEKSFEEEFMHYIFLLFLLLQAKLCFYLSNFKRSEGTTVYTVADML